MSLWRESGYINKVLPGFGKRNAVGCVCVVPSISLRLGLLADLAMVCNGPDAVKREGLHTRCMLLIA